MDKERLQWITRPATLDGWQVTVTYSETPSGTIATVWAAGSCSRKRGALWTHSETVAVDGDRYHASDLVHHLALVCDQDRPANDRQLTRALLGAAWDQPELPF